MLTLLQSVLGFDNLLYISIESKRAPVGHRSKVRRLGIGIAHFLRIILLYVVMKLIHTFHNSKSVGMIIFLIVSMNVDFSFDSIKISKETASISYEVGSVY